jgi:Transposase DNA-binding/Transposase Tn5 dimerisation domain
VVLNSFSDPVRWAEQQWGTATLGDVRRNGRAVQLGAALASCPQSSLPQQTGSWHELKAAYRLLNEPEVTHAALSEPHWQATRQQAVQADTVLFVQDTSELDFTAHRQTKDLGWIGNTGGRGFFLHSCLAVRPTAVPAILGLAAQQVWTRHGVRKGTETRSARAQRRKESDVWAEVVETIGPAPAAPERYWVSVSDRASDVFSFVRRTRAKGWHCLLRVSQNRAVLTASGQNAKLLDWAPRLPSQTETVIELRGREGQPGRRVRLQVAWSALALCPPRHGPERQQTPVSGWCVRCWEAGKRKNALEWVRFTTVPVTGAASALERIEWYRLRWVVEEYHKALKTGCALEQRQLQSAQGLLALLGFLAIVAVRLLQLRTVARTAPDTPANQVVEPELLEAVVQLRGGSADRMTADQFWRAVAGLGGFLGRKGDGNPGWQTLWRGWQRLQDLCWGLQQLPVPGKECG